MGEDKDFFGGQIRLFWNFRMAFSNAFYMVEQIRIFKIYNSYCFFFEFFKVFLWVGAVKRIFGDFHNADKAFDWCRKKHQRKNHCSRVMWRREGYYDSQLSRPTRAGRDHIFWRFCSAFFCFFPSCFIFEPTLLSLNYFKQKYCIWCNKYNYFLLIQRAAALADALPHLPLPLCLEPLCFEPNES